MEPIYEFTFFWKDGTSEVLEGASSADAFLNVGQHGRKDLSKISFWCRGSIHDWVWNGNRWVIWSEMERPATGTGGWGE